MIKRYRYLAALGLLALSSPLAIAGLGPGEMFITNYNANSVTVYSRIASGAAVPKRTILTGLNSPFGVLVDQLHNEVFVTNNCRSVPCGGFAGEVQVYDLNANYPNDTPKRTIVGGSTGLDHCTGLDLDLLRNELYVANDDGSSINVFSRTANGNVMPSRTIAGPATLLNGALAVVVDLWNNEIFVVNKMNYAGGAITVYPRSSNGNVSPIRSLQGFATMFNLPLGLSLDLLHNEFAVANADSSSILVFPRTAAGNEAPSRTLQGPDTGLCVPSGVIMDFVYNELIVANSGLLGATCSSSIAVYTRSASGDQTPLRTFDVGGGGGPVSVAETLLNWQ